MTWLLLVALAVLTVASRVLPMALLPTPHGRLAEILDALPAPLFASLAALALAGDGELPTTPALAATAGALLGATRRSLGLTLLCGIAGFFVARALVS
ncbi:MAG: AzlD domain-containing protein [Actinomycetota bacterium]|nr:AzlD domain-containing protein [Actinomycetota bacterium]